jgi:heat shock protein 5
MLATWKYLVIIFISIIFFSSNVSCFERDNSEGDRVVIGIDLGTTYSCVGIFRNDRVEIIPNELGNRITPSVVAFTDDERLVGEAAKNQIKENPKRTIYSIKRLIGRSFNDEEVQVDRKLLPYEIVNKEGRPYVEVKIKGQKNYFSPEEISSMILYKMKTIAEDYLGVEVRDAVVTVPAYFNNGQRQATKDAGKIAGLNVIRIINEPTAASFSYGLDKKFEEKNILVFDLGGGTFDISLLHLDSGIFEVLYTNGDTHLGGDDFDNKLLRYILDKIKNQKGIDITTNETALSILKIEVEKAKRDLSYKLETKIEIDSIIKDFNLNENLTRAKFEQLISPYFEKIKKFLDETMKNSNMKKTDINEILLIGGSTRIPKVYDFLKNYFDGKDPNKEVNPDEAVAYGAAIQAAILNGEVKVKSALKLVDATPLSLVIKVLGDAFSVVMPKGTPLPSEKTSIYQTVEDNQTAVNFEIYEGERSMAEDNYLLGKFYLKDIPPRPRGEANIEVTFLIDENSILEVRAVENSSKKSNKIIISDKSMRLKP